MGLKLNLPPEVFDDLAQQTSKAHVLNVSVTLHYLLGLESVEISEDKLKLTLFM